MCTVTIIPISRGFRLVHSRDEQHDRAEAEIPTWHELAPGVRAICPIDPESGGTWIASLEDGRVYATMNRNPFEPGRPPPPPPEGVRSRGELITLAATAGETPLAEALRPQVRRPFTLLEIGGPGVREARWDGERFEQVEHTPRAMCWVSSGLGDPAVADRLPLFETMVRPAPTPEAQDAFHLHQWPDRLEASVLMWREDARTVSITTIEFQDGQIRWGYRRIEPVEGEPAGPTG